MARKIRRLAHRVVKKHGLYSLLFGGIPVILPGFIETRTHQYLKLVIALSGAPDSSLDKIIGRIFGDRGLAVLQQYRFCQVRPITSTQMKKAFSEVISHPSSQAHFLNLINLQFFDLRQRSSLHSDVYRTRTIEMISDFILSHPEKQFQSLRSKLIRKLSLLTCVEQGIDPNHAIIQVLSSFISLTYQTEISRQQDYEKYQGEMLTARIKAELAGKSTALDPQFVTLTERPPLSQHFCTPSDLKLMFKALDRLADSDIPEIALSAHLNLRKLPTKAPTFFNQS